MPVIAGKYLYVHMPKTAGVWMSKYLQEQHDGLLLPGHGHMAASDVPGHHRKGRTVLGTARDPWSWYASWWAHAASREDDWKGLEAFGRGQRDFAEVLTGALAPNPDRAPEQIGVIWSVPRPTVERQAFLDRGVGLFSWAFNYIHDVPGVKIIDMNQIPAGLDQLMGAHVDKERYPPSNTKGQRAKKQRRLDYKKLYTKALIEAVWEADFELINKLGYTEPFAPARAGLTSL